MWKPSTKSDWAQPPQLTTQAGKTRRLGVELEFIGVTAAEAADLVERRFGGKRTRKSRHWERVEGGPLGDFDIKLDLRFPHGSAEEGPTGVPAVDEKLKTWAGDVAATMLPMEIVCPPIAIGDARQLEDLVTDLRDLGASGAGDGFMSAYGAQLNPELAELGEDAVLAHLRAFILLQDWLIADIGVTTSRRLLAFASPFPSTYAREIMAKPYAPRLGQLIDDYVRANPTRNRALDLLPLFRHLDEQRVVSALPNETINARPTFHYRLPNMALGDASWRLADEWRRWVKVERLASQPAALSALQDEWLATDSSVTGNWSPASRAIAQLL